jgi:hypothetical protein
MPFFALGSAPVLGETASMVLEVFPAAMADGCTLLGPPVLAKAAFDTCMRVGWSRGLDGNWRVWMGKCAMWGSSGLSADLDLPEEMERTEEKVVVLWSAP